MKDFSEGSDWGPLVVIVLVFIYFVVVSFT